MSKKTKKKLPEKTPDQIRAEQHESLMNSIIANTFARHAKLEEKDFLKAIGFEKTEKTEDEAVRIAMFNVMLATTKQIISLEGKLNMANGLFRTYMIEEGIAEIEKEK